MMRVGAWLTFTAVTGLLGACNGEVILANAGAGGGAGSGGQTIGASGHDNESQEAGAGGEAGSATGDGGSPSAAGGGAGPGGSGGVTQAVDPVDSQKTADKLDVLFVLDNSLGMASKQSVFAQSVDAFVSRLLNPRCVDAAGAPVATQPTSGGEPCSSGAREFTPVADLHLGVITTSLGSHGGDVCASENSTPDTHYDDKAQLLPSVRAGLASYQGSGFLAFDVSGKAGVTEQSVLSTQLRDVIDAAGQTGCGYEATLESMYRFLIDPTPPKSVTKASGSGVSAPQGVNDELLAQREAFLRPDSSVAIVILSDENDCSIQDTGVGWFVGAATRMPRATEVCEQDPNDPCCRSCAAYESAPPTGCAALKDDVNCGDVPAGSIYSTWDREHDSLNLRCFEQQRRFGFDLLNPVARYTVGLTNSQVYDWSGSLVQNPLFAARAGKGPRSNSLVSVSVIVGSPWQDLASDESRSGEGLTFFSAAQLDSAQRFPLLIGSGGNGKPTDPLMHESTDERTGTSPLTGESLAPASSTNPRANSANGHEQNIANLDDASALRTSLATRTW
jgi:hypothetical protein